LSRVWKRAGAGATVRAKKGGRVEGPLSQRGGTGRERRTKGERAIAVVYVEGRGKEFENQETAYADVIEENWRPR
jgi:hypothetical protein